MPKLFYSAIISGFCFLLTSAEARDRFTGTDETRSTARDVMIEECDTRYQYQREEFESYKRNWVEREKAKRERETERKYQTCVRNAKRQQEQFNRLSNSTHYTDTSPLCEVIRSTAGIWGIKYHGARSEIPIKKQRDACIQRANREANKEAKREQAQRDRAKREQAQRDRARRDQTKREQAQREQAQRDRAQRGQAQRETINRREQNRPNPPARKAQEEIIPSPECKELECLQGN